MTVPVLERVVTSTTGALVVAVYDIALDEAHTPPVGAFAMAHMRAVTSVAVSGRTVLIRVAPAYTSGLALTYTYTPPTDAADRLQDAAGDEAAAAAAVEVVNNVVAPLVPFNIGAATDTTGGVIVLRYSTALDEARVPPPGAFRVGVAPARAAAVTVSRVTIAGGIVTLHLSAPIEPDEMVTVSYVLPAAAAERIQDASGSQAHPFTPRPVENRASGDAAAAGAVLSYPLHPGGGVRFQSWNADLRRSGSSMVHRAAYSGRMQQVVRGVRRWTGEFVTPMFRRGKGYGGLVDAVISQVNEGQGLLRIPGAPRTGTIVVRIVESVPPTFDNLRVGSGWRCKWEEEVT